MKLGKLLLSLLIPAAIDEAKAALERRKAAKAQKRAERDDAR